MTGCLQLSFLAGLVLVLGICLQLPAWGAAITFGIYLTGSGIIGLILWGRHEDLDHE